MAKHRKLHLQIQRFNSKERLIHKSSVLLHLNKSKTFKKLFSGIELSLKENKI